MFGPPMPINRNSYKSYRIEPNAIPFREIALDHIGPFSIKNGRNENIKIYLLIVTCFYTRAVALYIIIIWIMLLSH